MYCEGHPIRVGHIPDFGFLSVAILPQSAESDVSQVSPNRSVVKVACGFELQCGLQVSKKQNVSSPFTREESILCGSPVRFSWLSLAYMCTKVT